ncbi:MAG: class I SAM-dependent rRNA methyltransferase [Bacteroidetes bacterium]|nr:MAG: class I SAM-dependent rRNA methyltransferase [Bacteroidota bacterium]PTM08016.1 MAG: class I SAM-dependent rRNA methyltransferase [Bacteroidota bacterium]
MLDDFPIIPQDRLAIRLKPAAERMTRKEHPWVFEASITKQNKEGKAGDLVVIFDQQKNKFLALGLYDPHSPIRVKLLQYKTPATIDGVWLSAKIQAAYARRVPLLATDTNSYRLLYGENDGLPGLVADVYADVLVVKIYSLIWWPYLHELFPLLLATSGCTTLVLRLSRNVQQDKTQLHGLYDGQVVAGTLEQPEVIFREHGIRFVANVIAGHKTGFFLDHRHNRKRVGELAQGQDVLDVFSYAGGFSVHALVGGARSVVSLDISSQALDMARKNARLNLAEPALNTLAQDAFVGLEELYQQGERFGLVIVDPPSFAKQASEREGALRSYTRLARLAIPLVAPGGVLLLASCSSRISADEFFQQAHDALVASGRPFQELERTFHDVDHPIGFPEGAYLKSIYFRL